MGLSALRGAVGFLTRLPAGADGDGWEAFRRSPWSFTPVGALVGALLAGAHLLGGLASEETAAVGLLAAWVGLTGVTHLDGVADLGDAAVVHGSADDRLAVLKDAQLGVGGTVALALALLGTGLGALGLAALPSEVAVGVVVASEVGAKSAQAAVACLGTARHEGLGSQVTEPNGPTDLVLPGLLAAVAVAVLLIGSQSPAPIAAFAGSVAAGLLLATWAARLLGGVNGDVFGAADVAARLAGYHVGLVGGAVGAAGGWWPL